MLESAEKSRSYYRSNCRFFKRKSDEYFVRNTVYMCVMTTKMTVVWKGTGEFNRETLEINL